jgi:CRISPR-associated protein Cas1
VDFLPLSYLNTFVFCPRRFYYEFVEGEMRVNEHIVEGKIRHERMESRRGEQYEEGRCVRRRVYVASEGLKLAGYLDVVEEEGGRIVPIEYKKGKVGRMGPWVNDQVQLCAGAMVLEENWGTPITFGYLYYAGSQHRYRVDFTDELRHQVKEAIRQAWDLVRRCATFFDRGITAVADDISHRMGPPIPEPVHDARCNGCSVATICLHDEITFLRGKDKPPMRPQPSLGAESVLYVNEQGTYLGKRKGRIRVEKDGHVFREIPVHQIDAVVICGNIEMSTPLERHLLREGIPVHFLSSLGHYEGSLLPPLSKNGLVRLCQYRAFFDLSKTMHLARSFVTAKLANMRALILRRSRQNPHERLHEAARRLKQAMAAAARAKTLAELLGVEGWGSEAYFSVFDMQLKEGMGFDFRRRTRRPPTDPVNALLSLAYSLLCADLVAAIHTVGLDPFIGFYHQPKYARPCLALDLMEEFRPIVADSVVMTLINNGMIKPSDFEIVRGAYYLGERAREVFYAAYERRKSETITHPTFKYRISYRRAFELQARILGKYLVGELDKYYPLFVR